MSELSPTISRHTVQRIFINGALPEINQAPHAALQWRAISIQPHLQGLVTKITKVPNELWLMQQVNRDGIQPRLFITEGNVAPFIEPYRMTDLLSVARSLMRVWVARLIKMHIRVFCG